MQVEMINITACVSGRISNALLQIWLGRGWPRYAL